MVVTHEAKTKQHACTSSGLCKHYSELFTQMMAAHINPYGRYRLEITYSTSPT